MLDTQWERHYYLEWVQTGWWVLEDNLSSRFYSVDSCGFSSIKQNLFHSGSVPWGVGRECGVLVWGSLERG